MAKKERPKALKVDLEINLTPMIDVVFNLIIFFMIITDMTQKDLEYLVLPKADAIPDIVEDKERIIVNIINFDSKENEARIAKGDIRRDLPPILIQGTQVQSLEQFRQRLRLLADPTLYPDLDGPDLGGGLRASRKPLLVRCDQGQIFGWVQAVMQYCTFVPGRPPAQEFKESPFIRKFEIAVAEKTPGS